MTRVLARAVLQLAALLTATAFGPAASAAPSASDATILVTTAPCPESSTSPTFSLLKMNDRGLAHTFLHGPTSLAQSQEAHSHLDAQGKYESLLHAAPGNYEVYVRAGDCFGQKMVGVVAGQNRAVEIRTGAGVKGLSWATFFDHDHVSLTGEISIPVSAMTLVNAGRESEKRTVSLEGGRFYADSLPRYRWYLDVQSGCCGLVRFPLDLRTMNSGDFVSLDLSENDLRHQMTYRGPLFAGVTAIATSGRLVWYLDPDRHTIGTIERDGSHREFGIGSVDAGTIDGDGIGGVWVANYKGTLLHFDAAGHVLTAKIPHGDDPYLRYFGAGTTMLVSDPKARAMYRVSSDMSVSRLKTPEDFDPAEDGIDATGARWFQPDWNQDTFLRLDSHELSAPTNASTVTLEPGVSILDGAFLELLRANDDKSPYPLVRGIGYAHCSAGFDGYCAASGAKGELWLSSCDRHVISLYKYEKLQVSAPLGDLPCPIEMYAADDGTLWFRGEHSSVLNHRLADGTIEAVQLPDPTERYGRLTVDWQNTPWFIEWYPNRIAYYDGSRIVEINLGVLDGEPQPTIIL